MARQVYFDPFGRYTEGYDQGTGRELQVQREGRQNRLEDYQYNNFLPLQLRNQQREDTLGQAILPYRIAAAPLSYEDQRQQLFSRQLGNDYGVSRLFGLGTPAAAHVADFYGFHYAPGANGQVNWTDNQGTPIGATGDINSTVYNDANYERAMQQQAAALQRLGVVSNIEDRRYLLPYQAGQINAQIGYLGNHGDYFANGGAAGARAANRPPLSTYGANSAVFGWPGMGAQPQGGQGNQGGQGATPQNTTGQLPAYGGQSYYAPNPAYDAFRVPQVNTNDGDLDQ